MSHRSVKTTFKAFEVLLTQIRQALLKLNIAYPVKNEELRILLPAYFESLLRNYKPCSEAGYIMYSQKIESAEGTFLFGVATIFESPVNKIFVYAPELVGRYPACTVELEIVGTTLQIREK